MRADDAGRKTDSSSKEEARTTQQKATIKAMSEPHELITTDRLPVARRAEHMRLDNQVLKVRFNGVEIEIPLQEINIVLGGQQGVTSGRNRKANYVRCGNCLKKIPTTGDPEQDHHAVMKHRVEECQKAGIGPAREQRQLIEEFEAQDHVPETRRLLAAPPPAPKRKRFWSF